jgi:hypothetical protein
MPLDGANLPCFGHAAQFNHMEIRLRTDTDFMKWTISNLNSLLSNYLLNVLNHGLLVIVNTNSCHDHITPNFDVPAAMEFL